MKMRTKITKHKDSAKKLEQVIVSKGGYNIRFNLWAEGDEWVTESVGLAKKIKIYSVDRDEAIRMIEETAKEHFIAKQKER